MSSYNPRYQKGRPFLVVEVLGRPAQHVRTHRAGWTAEHRNWQSSERPRVVDSLGDKDMARATVIIDILENKLVKNRFSDQEAETVLRHYLSKYAEYVEQGLRLWRARTGQAG